MDESKKDLTGVTIDNEETVSVKKTDLDRLFKTIDRQSKDIETLYKAADKGKIAEARWNDRNASLVKTCKLSRWDYTGQLILAWKMTENFSEIIAGREVANQKVEIFFEDGKTELVQLLDFYRHRKPEIVVEIIGEIKGVDDKGNTTTEFKVQFPDGKQLVISEKFIN